MVDDPSKLMESLSSPIGDLIAQVGRSVADAQAALDETALANLQAIADSDNVDLAALRAIGYRPTWYHIPECAAELSVALSMSGRRSESGNQVLYAAPVDAEYGNTYNYDLKASSRLTFKVVPVPEPATVEQQVVAPRLTDMNLGEARSRAIGLGLSVTAADVDDNTMVIGQEPAAGELMPNGGNIELLTEDPIS